MDYKTWPELSLILPELKPPKKLQPKLGFFSDFGQTAETGHNAKHSINLFRDAVKKTIKYKIRFLNQFI